MTLEELHNLVSELHERYSDDTEVFVSDHYADLQKINRQTIIGHYEPHHGFAVALVIADVPAAE